MIRGEKKTIISVLILYLTSTLLVILALSYTYYLFEKENFEKNFEKEFTKESEKVFKQIEQKHLSFTATIEYPRFEEFQSALYDAEQNLIFSTLHKNSIDLNKTIFIDTVYSYYVSEIYPYYLGAKFIVIEKKTNTLGLENIQNKILLPALGIFFIILLTSLFLVKLLLKPMRNNIKLLDRFIQDSTHELNTPLSTILTNVELLENKIFEPSLQNKINRIKTASLTLSNIYEDLVYLTLNKTLPTDNEEIDLSSLINKRLEYFSAHLKAKNIKVKVIHNEECFLYMDKKKLIRMMDNLLSNSIKYSKQKTTIQIIVTKNSCSILDEGKGMNSDQVAKIFDRYSRFDTTQGGFGIGYSIIHSITKEYNINISIDSKINEGTCVTLKWQS